ncbi:MAG: ABC transporter substrate-binding protein [Lachnospiraceae bacterium]|nr:ABC transporter substrate-binding protein [Lachnospiraceae bacterium]
MKKKIVSAVLCLSMAAALLAGCGSSSSTTADTAEETTEAETEEEVAEEEAEAVEETEEVAEESEEAAEVTTVTEGVLTMGTNAAFPPYEYYDDADEIVGIDAEIAEALAEKLGLTLEIVDMDFSSIITSVQSGKIDVGIAGMTVTEDRLENVNFTDSYATGIQVIIVPEGSEITSVDDLSNEDILIGVQEGTTGHTYCSDDYGEDRVIAYTNGATAVQALLQGKVDCVVIDEQPALSYVEANEGLEILETEYVVEDYAIAVSKDNEALLDALNTALAELIEDGTVQSILDTYITAE